MWEGLIEAEAEDGFGFVIDGHVNDLGYQSIATPGSLKAYHEARWAELSDYRDVPVEVPLRLLDALHTRWVGLLRALSPEDLRREFVHPDSGPVQLDVNIGIYAWHGRHHLRHITALAEREGWS